MAHLMEGKAGLVTGAGSGIGRGSALAFAEAGAKVVVSDMNEAGGKETVQLINKLGGEAEFFKCDVSDEEQVKALVDYTVKTYGKLDFAHNNAGLTTQPRKVGEVLREDWEKTINVNLSGTFYCMKYEIIAMRDNGGGAIVNTASTAGLEGSQNMSAYVASKFGVVGLTKTAAIDHGREGIRVNAIAPGTTSTPIVEKLMEQIPDQVEEAKRIIPTGEFATPEDQGNAAVFLCSDMARQINGVTLAVDGGYTAGK